MLVEMRVPPSTGFRFTNIFLYNNQSLPDPAIYF
jgi:hypothetical protein